MKGGQVKQQGMGRWKVAVLSRQKGMGRWEIRSVLSIRERVGSCPWGLTRFSGFSEE